MHVQHGGTARPFVQIIDVLGYDQHLAGVILFQPRQRPVRVVRRNGRVSQRCPARIVERLHGGRVTLEGFGCRHILQPYARPDAVAIPERRQAAFPADAGAGQHHDACFHDAAFLKIP